MVDPKKVFIIHLCKQQLMKTTAQGPEGMECGSYNQVIDPFGIQVKRSMTSMVKLCYAALF